MPAGYLDRPPHRAKNLLCISGVTPTGLSLTYQYLNLKKASLFVGTHSRICSCCALTGLVLAPHIFPVSIASAAPNEVRITAIVKEANLVTNDAGRRAGSVGDAVRIGNEIITGIDSRAELTFEDKAVARLSANAALTLKSKNVLELSHGAVLLQFPGRTKGKVQAGAVSAAVGNATALLEYQPTVFKFLVLEGTARLYRPARLGDSILVRAGQMVFGNANASLTDPVDFDIERFVKTCPLIQNFASLENERAIAAANEKQQRDKSKKRLLDTNLIMFGGGSTVSVVGPDKRSSEAATTTNPTATTANPFQRTAASETRP